jgi:glutathione S-transferase
MEALTLVIGNRKYSSWSMRPFLLLRKLGVDFCVQQVSLYDARAPVAWPERSPASRLVPQLVVGESLRVWDSLAIGEYVAEAHPAAWPARAAARAAARSVCAEIHSGLAALRRELPMNCGRDAARGVRASAAAAADIRRVVETWAQCRERFAADGGGPWLFGRFSVADAFCAPPAVRLAGYGVAVGGEGARAYFDHVLADADVREWVRAGREEAATIAAFEV